MCVADDLDADSVPSVSGQVDRIASSATAEVEVPAGRQPVRSFDEPHEPMIGDVGRLGPEAELIGDGSQGSNRRVFHHGVFGGLRVEPGVSEPSQRAVAGGIASSTFVELSESPAALRSSRKSSIIASVTSCGSSTVAPSVSTEMLSWST